MRNESEWVWEAEKHQLNPAGLTLIPTLGFENTVVGGGWRVWAYFSPLSCLPIGWS